MKTLIKFLLTNIPVNKLITIPKANVIAKPRIGPDVFKNDQSRGFANTKQVMRVAA